MKATTQANLIETLQSIRGATFATLVTETDAKLRKNNPFGTVRKVSRVNVCLGFQYEAAVNRQRDREGSEPDFQAAPRQWGERQGMIVRHKGRTYLETKVERSLETVYLDASGRQIPVDDLRPYMLARSGSSRQGTDKEIVVRDYALDSIRSLAFGGETYVMLQEIPLSNVPTTGVKVKV